MAPMQGIPGRKPVDFVHEKPSFEDIAPEESFSNEESKAVSACEL